MDLADLEVVLQDNTGLSTDDIIAKQNDFIARLEGTFNMWETTINMDQLSIDQERQVEDKKQTPQFHEFGLQADLEPQEDAMDDADISRLRIDDEPSEPVQKPNLPPPSIVITPSPEDTPETALSRLRLAQDSTLAAAAALSVHFPRHPSHCHLCGLEKGLRTHKARCARRRGLHFSCPSCRAPFTRRVELVQHLRKVRRSQGRGEGKACPSCKLCTRSYGTRGWGRSQLRGAEGTVFVEGCGFVNLDD